MVNHNGSRPGGIQISARFVGDQLGRHVSAYSIENKSSGSREKCYFFSAGIVMSYVTAPIASLSKMFSTLPVIVLLGIFVVSGCNKRNIEQREQREQREQSAGTTGSAPLPLPAPAPDDRTSDTTSSSSATPDSNPDSVSGSSPASGSASTPPSTRPDSLPLFWPPPNASTYHRIPRELIATGKISEQTWGSVATRMEQALETNGYSAFRYYAVPKGFALITQLERINEDATFARQRWDVLNVDPVRIGAFSLGAYLNALLGRDAGLFRVIAFVFTSEPIVTSGKEPLISEAKSWIKEGRWLALPSDLSGQVYGEKMLCTALIYEFEVPRRGAPAILRNPSRNPGWRHLEAAKILQALRE